MEETFIKKLENKFHQDLAPELFVVAEMILEGRTMTQIQRKTRLGMALIERLMKTSYEKNLDN